MRVFDCRELPVSRGGVSADDDGQQQSQTDLPGGQEDPAQPGLPGQLRDGNLLQGRVTVRLQDEG